MLTEDNAYPAAGKAVLVIGASCVDVVIRVDSLPSKGGHCMALSQKMMPGGCACNVAFTLRRMETPVKFITPVGTGLYGRLVKKWLTDEGFTTDIIIPEENGCCYCLIESDGERTFIPLHGGEYAFDKEWMKGITPSDYAFVYVCGIEISEPTGENIVSWLEENAGACNKGPEVFFAPSPHIGEIKPDLVARLLALHPILHLNEDESYIMSGRNEILGAALSLREKTENAVIITLASDGALCLEKEGDPLIVPALKCEAADTNGAGDTHAGALLSALTHGLTMRAAVTFANEAAAAKITADHTRSAIS